MEAGVERELNPADTWRAGPGKFDPGAIGRHFPFPMVDRLAWNVAGIAVDDGGAGRAGLLGGNRDARLARHIERVFVTTVLDGLIVSEENLLQIPQGCAT